MIDIWQLDLTRPTVGRTTSVSTPAACQHNRIWHDKSEFGAISIVLLELVTFLWRVVKIWKFNIPWS